MEIFVQIKEKKLQYMKINILIFYSILNLKMKLSQLQLDNSDLIFAGKYNNTLYIYRLKDNKYFLFQIIKEDIKGYRMKIDNLGFLIHRKFFELEWIKKLSNNKFISIFNYGFKMYSLNSSNKYL